MRVPLGLMAMVMTISVPAFAELPEAAAQQHIVLASRWHKMRQFQKAVEEYQQAYLLGGNPRCLYFMAQSHEQLAGMPTKTISEVLENKMQALGLYQTFIEDAAQGEPGLEVARSRIDPLGREIKELAAQKVEREVSLKELRDEIRELRELILRWMRGERAAIPTNFVLPNNRFNLSYFKNKF